jgi:predicted 2-oxoglutarate/Fe(II)-dependent dioxygenase YbiX
LIRGKVSDNKQQLFDHKTHVYLYFEAMVGLACSNDPESYAGGKLVVGSPMPNMSKVITQPKKG